MAQAEKRGSIEGARIQMQYGCTHDTGGYYKRDITMTPSAWITQLENTDGLACNA